jgi:hypothetical protein
LLHLIHPSSFSFLQRKPGETSVCVRHWLEVLNSCDALVAAAPNSECVQTLQGRDLPAYRSNDHKVTLMFSSARSSALPRYA